MWSDRYYYLNIYKNERLSEEVSTTELTEFISGISELENDGILKFKNIDSAPFVRLALLKSQSANSWSEGDRNSKSTNLITVVCSKVDGSDFEKVQNLLTQIAKFLNWKLVNEETDDGIKNFVLWQAK